MLGGPLGISLARYIQSSKTLSRWIKPFALWYAGVSGYRRLGLKYDDLILEERPDVQKALSRLDERASYDRIFRIRRASQASIVHHDLDKSEWTRGEEDTRFLASKVLDAFAEDQERMKWDTMQVKGSKRR